MVKLWLRDAITGVENTGNFTLLSHTSLGCSSGGIGLQTSTNVCSCSEVLTSWSEGTISLIIEPSSVAVSRELSLLKKIGVAKILPAECW